MPKTNLKALMVRPRGHGHFDQCKQLNYTLFDRRYLTHYLIKEDICHADYMDMYYEQDETLFRRLKEGFADIVVITSSHYNRIIAMDLMDQIRSKFPQTIIVTGGILFGLFPEESLQNISSVDFVIHGDGERTLGELVFAIADGKNDYSNIKGISYREGAEIISNQAQSWETEDDQLCMDVSLIEKKGEPYEALHPIFKFEDEANIRGYSISTSRGCPVGCMYCQHQNYPFRIVEIETVLKHIENAMQKYKTQFFLFNDLSFGVSSPYLEKLCDALIEREMNIKWYCQVRPTLSYSQLSLMKKAGCISLICGIETGSDKIMSVLGRQTTRKQIIEFTKNCHQLCIRFNYFSMISYPEENMEDVFDTIVLLKELASYGAETGITPLQILPCTKLEEYARNRNIMSKNFSWFDRTYRCNYSFVHPVFQAMPHYLDKLNEKQINKALGFFAAIQDFVHREPRVAKLTPGFVKTIVYVIMEFFFAIPASKPKKRLSSLKLGLWVFYQYIYWKIKKVFMTEDELNRPSKGW